MATDLTAECLIGYRQPDTRNPFMFSSDCWLAFEAGRRITGMSNIKRCRKSRGYSVRIELASGATVIITAKGKQLDQFIIDRT